MGALYWLHQHFVPCQQKFSERRLQVVLGLKTIRHYVSYICLPGKSVCRSEPISSYSLTASKRATCWVPASACSNLLKYREVPASLHAIADSRFVAS